MMSIGRIDPLKWRWMLGYGYHKLVLEAISKPMQSGVIVRKDFAINPGHLSMPPASRNKTRADFTDWVRPSTEILAISDNAQEESASHSLDSLCLPRLG